MRNTNNTNVNQQQRNYRRTNFSSSGESSASAASSASHANAASANTVANYRAGRYTNSYTARSITKHMPPHSQLVIHPLTPRHVAYTLAYSLALNSTLAITAAMPPLFARFITSSLQQHRNVYLFPYTGIETAKKAASGMSEATTLKINPYIDINVAKAAASMLQKNRLLYLYAQTQPDFVNEVALNMPPQTLLLLEKGISKIAASYAAHAIKKNVVLLPNFCDEDILVTVAKNLHPRNTLLLHISTPRNTAIRVLGCLKPGTTLAVYATMPHDIIQLLETSRARQCEFRVTGNRIGNRNAAGDNEHTNDRHYRTPSSSQSSAIGVSLFTTSHSATTSTSTASTSEPTANRTQDERSALDALLTLESQRSTLHFPRD